MIHMITLFAFFLPPAPWTLFMGVQARATETAPTGAVVPQVWRWRS